MLPSISSRDCERVLPDTEEQYHSDMLRMYVVVLLLLTIHSGNLDWYE